MTTRRLEPAQAATMLRDRGIQAASVATPSAMAEALCRACGDHGLSIRSVPHDFDAIRAALAAIHRQAASSPVDAEGSRVTPANIDSLPETGGRA